MKEQIEHPDITKVRRDGNLLEGRIRYIKMDGKIISAKIERTDIFGEIRTMPIF